MTALSTLMSHNPLGRLRVLETTDLHMQLLDYDYFADRADNSIGLIGLADQIQALRDEEGITTLLCDNGDLLQGNPLADHLAAHWPTDAVHPMIAALNTLQYDAMTLGNHEFDYGLTFLRNALAKAAFPIVCANIHCADNERLAVPFVILDRDILCNDGKKRPIKIGITGFAPPQIAEWDDPFSDSGVKVDDIATTASEIVPRMLAAEADVIIALCHSGIGAEKHRPRMENAALPLAEIDGIDALLLGHTHEAFPDPNLPSTAQVDYAAGRLRGKPAVMATFYGKSLGVLELDLRWGEKGWTIAGQSARLVPIAKASEDSALCQDLRRLVNAPHIATLAKIRAPIAQTQVPIASYFATIQPDLSQQLLARAMQRTVETALKDTPHAALPLLAAKSSFRFGGRGGLGHYIDISPGPITLRDAAAIFPFNDALCAVRRTGKQLRLWLERAAAHYNQILPGVQDQPLINPKSAGYNCDTIQGLSYQIDLSQPARFDAHGVEQNAKAARVQNIRYQGKKVADNDVFMVATNSFRAKGGGGFPIIAAEDIVLTSAESVRRYLIDYLTETGTITTPVHATWSFSPIPDTAARFASAPAACEHMSGPISHIGASHDGFDTYQIRF